MWVDTSLLAAKNGLVYTYLAVCQPTGSVLLHAECHRTRRTPFAVWLEVFPRGDGPLVVTGVWMRASGRGNRLERLCGDRADEAAVNR